MRRYRTMLANRFYLADHTDGPWLPRPLLRKTLKLLAAGRGDQEKKQGFIQEVHLPSQLGYPTKELCEQLCSFQRRGKACEELELVGWTGFG